MKRYFGITMLFSFIVGFLSGFVFKTWDFTRLKIASDLHPNDEWKRDYLLKMWETNKTFFQIEGGYNYNWTVASFTFGILAVFFFTLSRTIYYDKLMRIFKR